MKQLIVSDEFAKYLTELVAMQPKLAEEDYTEYEKLKDINPDYLSEEGKEFIKFVEENKFNGETLTFTDYGDKDEHPFWVHELFENIDNLYNQGKITHVEVISDCDQGNEGDVLQISDYDGGDIEHTFRVATRHNGYDFTDWISNVDIIPIVDKEDN